LFLAIANRQSTFGNSSGGIAQLVERQLCKLEVRGSNPLASSLRPPRSGARRLSRRSLGEGGSQLFLLFQLQRTDIYIIDVAEAVSGRSDFLNQLIVGKTFFLRWRDRRARAAPKEIFSVS
jgi:hypothetical protein